MKARIPKQEPTSDVLVVSFDAANGTDKSILLVGRKPPRKDVEILNAVEGQEAEELYAKLIGARGETK